MWRLKVMHFQVKEPRAQGLVMVPLAIGAIVLLLVVAPTDLDLTADAFVQAGVGVGLAYYLAYCIFRAIYSFIPGACSIRVDDVGIHVFRWPWTRTIRWDGCEQIDMGYYDSVPALVGIGPGCKKKLLVMFEIKPQDRWWDAVREEIVRRGLAGPVLAAGETAPWTSVDVNLKTGEVSGRNSGKKVT